MEERKKLHILDVPVDKVDMRQAVQIFAQLMETEGCSLIVTPNSEIVLGATKDPELKSLIESADLTIPDGVGLVYASRILKEPLAERVTGIDFMELALIWLMEHGKSVYLLGSKPGVEGAPSVAEMAAAKKQQQYPELKIAGAHHGYFKPEEEAALVEEINRSGADFLCVGLGSPRQEQFIKRHQQELKVSVAIGIGGSLDVWAETLKRAPEFYQKHGLEWLYRFKQEPTRYKRMARLPVFMLKVLINK